MIKKITRRQLLRTPKEFFERIRHANEEYCVYDESQPAAFLRKITEEDLQRLKQENK